MRLHVCILSFFVSLFAISPLWGEEKTTTKEDKIDEIIINDTVLSEATPPATPAVVAEIRGGDGEQIDDEEGDIDRPENDKELASLVMSDEDVIPYRDYSAPYNSVWKGVLKSLKFYPLQSANKFIGQVQTRWIDDTLWRRLLEKGEDDYGNEKPSKIKILISVRKITQKKTLSSEKGGGDKKITEQLTRVVVYKRHQEYDSDSEKWKSYPSDWLLEEALFYNIEHAVSMQRKIAELFQSEN